MEYKTTIKYLSILSGSSSLTASILDEENQQLSCIVLTSFSLASSLVIFILSRMERKLKDSERNLKLFKDEINSFLTKENHDVENSSNFLAQLKLSNEEINTLSEKINLSEVLVEKDYIKQQSLLFASSIISLIAAIILEESDNAEITQIILTGACLVLAYLLEQRISAQELNISVFKFELEKISSAQAENIANYTSNLEVNTDKRAESSLETSGSQHVNNSNAPCLNFSYNSAYTLKFCDCSGQDALESLA